MPKDPCCLSGAVSQRFLEIPGYAEHELTGKGSAVVYPDDPEFHRVGMEKRKQIAATGSLPGSSVPAVLPTSTPIILDI